MNKIAKLTAILVGGLATSCVEEYDLKINNEQEYYVIDAIINDVDTVHVVNVYRNGDLCDTWEPAIEDITVKIEDQNGWNAEYENTKNGREFTLYGQPFEAGNTYTLTVKIGKQTFRATEYMCPLPVIDSLTFYSHSTLDEAEVFSPIVYMHDSQPDRDNYYIFTDQYHLGENRYHWSHSHFLYIDYLSDKGMKEEMSGIRISIGMGAYDGQKGAGVHLWERYYYEILTVSKENYEFFKAMSNQLSSDGGIYRPFPITPRTNFEGNGKVLGQFMACSKHIFEGILTIDDI